jgi:DNA replication protein DnaC
MTDTAAKTVFHEKQGIEKFTCEKHGDYAGEIVTLHSGAVSMKINPQCPQCQSEIDEKNALQNALEENRKMKNMNVGKGNLNIDFSTFSAYTPELKRHLEAAQEFARNRNGKKLVMLGGNGTGKTHLAISILRQTGGLIYTTYEIGVNLRASYNKKNGEWKVFNELCETPLLAIDEIGRTKGGDFEINWISHVINKRHENLLPVILISNRHLMDDCPNIELDGKRGCQKCLENYFDNDVLSRIVEDGVIMKFTGEDYRYKKRTLSQLGEIRHDMDTE